jgi:predicted amidohydrolase
MAAVRVGIAQLNALVGDLAGNAAQVLEAARRAHEQGARVLLTPELMLTGLPTRARAALSGFGNAGRLARGGWSHCCNPWWLAQRGFGVV